MFLNHQLKAKCYQGQLRGKFKNSKKCLLSPCFSFAKMSWPFLLKQGCDHQILSISLVREMVLEITVARSWQWALQSPCLLWTRLVFNRLRETRLSVPIPAAEMISKVVVTPLVLIERRIFLEGPAAGMTIGGRWKYMEMGMNIGLAVPTIRCKSTFEQKISCGNEIQQWKHGASWIKVIFMGTSSIKSVLGLCTDLITYMVYSYRANLRSQFSLPEV